jgi:hypothetical protein
MQGKPIDIIRETYLENIIWSHSYRGSRHYRVPNFLIRIGNTQNNLIATSVVVNQLTAMRRAPTRLPGVNKAEQIQFNANLGNKTVPHNILKYFSYFMQT